jgi:hypothetical protein
MMEDEKTNKHGKKKINTSLGSITIGGEGGITGLLVFGGALALAGFMAVTSFGTRKHKRKAIHPHHQQILLDDDHKDHSLVQYSTTQFGEDVTSYDRIINKYTHITQMYLLYLRSQLQICCKSLSCSISLQLRL